MILLVREDDHGMLLLLTVINNGIRSWHKQLLGALLVLKWLLLLVLLPTILKYLLAGRSSVLFKHLHLVDLVVGLAVRYTAILGHLVVGDAVGFWTTKAALLLAAKLEDLLLLRLDEFWSCCN